jgi:hypothetical protein
VEAPQNPEHIVPRRRRRGGAGSVVTRAFGAWVVVALFFAWPVPTAHADNTLNSSEKPDKAQKPPGQDGKTEFTLLPGVGGSTDIGIGGGFFMTLTRLQAGYVPYVWNLEAAWTATGIVQDGRVQVPYNDGYLKLTVDRFLDAPVRFDVRPSFTDEEVLYYYGMGNASSANLPPGQPTHYFAYGRVHPSIFLDLASRIRDHVAGRLMLRYTGSSLHIAENTRLADDRAQGSAEVKKLIGPTDGFQSVALIGYAVAFDTRDNEISPHRGTWDEASVNISPGGTPDFPYRYAELNAVFRAYLPLASRVTLAMRIGGDVLAGNPPFAELPRWGDGYAVGGQNGVRGVPAQRYYGKVKVLGNVEVRAHFFDFRLLGKGLTLGGAAFADGGRVWADTTPHPELDGTGLGLKYGLGGGLRLSSGTAFVLRADVAWSPDATPISGYVTAGEIF